MGGGGTQFSAAQLSDSDDIDDDEFGVAEGGDAKGDSKPPLRGSVADLNDIWAEDEMAPMTLPKDPKGVEEAEERKALGADFQPDMVCFRKLTRFYLVSTDCRSLSVKPDVERLYIFQFPRVFPTFRRPQDEESQSAEPQEAGGDDIKPDPDSADVKPKVKKTARPGEYVAGEWGGWGKGGGREGRDPIGGGVDGLVGRMQVRESGRVTLKMGDIDYDVSVILTRRVSFAPPNVCVLVTDPPGSPTLFPPRSRRARPASRRRGTCNNLVRRDVRYRPDVQEVYCGTRHCPGPPTRKCGPRGSQGV
jgi:hypothetical protein